MTYITKIEDITEGDLYKGSNGHITVEVVSIRYNSKKRIILVKHLTPLVKGEDGKPRKRLSPQYPFDDFKNKFTLYEKNKDKSFDLESNKKRFNKFYDTN